MISIHNLEEQIGTRPGWEIDCNSAIDSLRVHGRAPSRDIDNKFFSDFQNADITIGLSSGGQECIEISSPTGSQGFDIVFLVNLEMIFDDDICRQIEEAVRRVDLSALYDAAEFDTEFTLRIRNEPSQTGHHWLRRPEDLLALTKPGWHKRVAKIFLRPGTDIMIGSEMVRMARRDSDRTYRTDWPSPDHVRVSTSHNSSHVVFVNDVLARVWVGLFLIHISDELHVTDDVCVARFNGLRATELDISDIGAITFSADAMTLLREHWDWIFRESLYTRIEATRRAISLNREDSIQGIVRDARSVTRSAIFFFGIAQGEILDAVISARSSAIRGGVEYASKTQLHISERISRAVTNSFLVFTTVGGILLAWSSGQLETRESFVFVCGCMSLAVLHSLAAFFTRLPSGADFQNGLRMSIELGNLYLSKMDIDALMSLSDIVRTRDRLGYIRIIEMGAYVLSLGALMVAGIWLYNKI